MSLWPACRMFLVPSFIIGIQQSRNRNYWKFDNSNTSLYHDRLGLWLFGLRHAPQRPHYCSWRAFLRNTHKHSEFHPVSMGDAHSRTTLLPNLWHFAVIQTAIQSQCLRHYHSLHRLGRVRSAQSGIARQATYDSGRIVWWCSLGRHHQGYERRKKQGRYNPTIQYLKVGATGYNNGGS